jgi:FtsP/CotA-like multicopper oxidase with cupredoxin domain
MRSRSLSVIFPIILFVLAGAVLAAENPQIPLPGSAIPQFFQRLPQLSIAPQNGTIKTVLGNTSLNLRMCEFRAFVLPANGIRRLPPTWVWGYLVDPDPGGSTPCAKLIPMYADANGVVDTYTGPVVVNQRFGGSTNITYVNELGTSYDTNVLAYKYSTDQTLHWADPTAPWPSANLCMMTGGIPLFGSFCAQNYKGPVAAVPHLHGGEVPAEIDGSPDSWFTSDGAYTGHKYYSAGGAPANGARYRYPNLQEAAPIWFHDHTLGATRLNVYAGLAGAYLIDEPRSLLPPTFPPLSQVIPLVIQDRMFDVQGQLYFQAGVNGKVQWAPNPEHPYWKPEFIGDTILVNGKAWPYLTVEPRRYTFLFLNGSNARSYELYLSNTANGAIGPSMWVVGTDGGYLDRPVKLDARPPKGPADKLLIMPGERYMVTIDFAGITPGTSMLLNNVASAPYPGGDPVDPATTAKVMQFNVIKCASSLCGPADPTFDPSTGKHLRQNRPIVRLVEPLTGTLAPGVRPAVTRQLTLNEVMGDARTEVNPINGQLTDYPGGPLEILVNNTKWSGESPRTYGDFTPITVNGVTTRFSETPAEGTTEVWEIVNLTADAHPIHLHLAQFQLMNRQGFAIDQYIADYGASFPSGVYEPDFGPPFDYRATLNPLSGGKDGGNPDVAPYLDPIDFHPPKPEEAGWKDTVMAQPNQVTRLVVRWAPTDLLVGTVDSMLFYPFDPSGSGTYNYVWHCHIIDHEDNEMMRPDTIKLNPLAPAPANRPVKKGIDY